MRTARNFIVAVLVILALAVSPMAIATAYVNLAGIMVDGEVIGKREAFVMSGGDRWQHRLEITYRYQQSDSRYPATAAHPVDPSLYGRLRVGSPVRVRYSPWHPLRPMVGVGSFLVETSWHSRIAFESSATRDVAELATLGIALLLAYLAYRWRSRPLGLIAGLVNAVWLSAILLAGFFVFPLLFWIWRRNPGRGFGVLLLASMALSTAALYWRIPQPTSPPSSPSRDAVAFIRHTQIVDQIWTSREEGGQNLRRPFQMLDLEFTPEGATEPVHVLDRVDLDSVPGLHEGATVRVLYSLSDPRAARLAGGTRAYAEATLVNIVCLTYGIGALVVLVGWLVMRLAESVRRRFAGLGAGVRLPVEDPRRKVLEAHMRARIRTDG